MTHNGLASMKQAVRNVDLSAVPQGHADRNIGKGEQDASLVGGAILLGIGIVKISHASGWLALGLGAGLLHRGLTGTCGLYKALGVDTSK